jgi:hypothetical protein
MNSGFSPSRTMPLSQECFVAFLLLLFMAAAVFLQGNTPNVKLSDPCAPKQMPSGIERCKEKVLFSSRKDGLKKTCPTIDLMPLITTGYSGRRQSKG